MDAATMELVRWLVNQGVGVAIAGFLLWRLDSRLAAIEASNTALAEHLDALATALMAQLTQPRNT